uniref:ATP synthase subunit a n=1 Tax=Scydmaeninae sp. 840218 TaxID=1213605 RepID=A0A0S2MP82_9COLE|nr:ATP synthase F0 subunit 6 [Scydmaeninae sp. 840218]
MMNLFTSFDPSTYIFQMNWTSMLMMIPLMPIMLWLVPSRWNWTWLKLNFSLNNEFTPLLESKIKGSTLMFISLMNLIMINNFMGLSPYTFTPTSHLVFNLSLALPLWVMFMVYGWFNNSVHMLAHTIPTGTPYLLMPFMVCIETVSNIIRPITLSVRLTANMIAGHLLVTLMSNLSATLGTISCSIVIIAQTILLILEMSVAIIQAYVFSVLVMLYSKEIH